MENDDKMHLGPDGKPWFETIGLPVLLRHARTTYGAAMRKALDEAGYDDIPGNGLYVIGGLALQRDDIPLGELDQAAAHFQASRRPAGGHAGEPRLPGAHRG